MKQESRNICKGAETVTEIMMILKKAKIQLHKLTREDINYLRGRLDLLEYLLAPKSGAQIDEFKPFVSPPCEVCGPKPTTYHFRDKWYCLEHSPAGTSWPVGMHGDDLKAYRERK
jgi:hypothetical protein